MKTNLFRNIVATTSLLAGLAGFSAAQANVVNGSLGAAASATDHYHVTCPLFATTRIEGNVTDLIPIAAPLVSMQIHKGNLATNTTDPIDGFQFVFPFPQQLPSPTISLFSGGGVYDVLIDKTAAGAENYRMYVQCFGGFTGGPLPTTVVQVQNQ